MDDYLRLNRAMWDSRADAHASSPDYALDRLRADPAALSDVVRFDRPRLGAVDGLDVVHLQCHIGTDTLSLARLGARVVGLDLSPASLEQARTLAAQTGTDIEYVESDVHDAPQALDGRRFDVVYTGIGAICWLPSIERWASTVAALLRPGGRVLLRDIHPAFGAMELEDGELVLRHPYFEVSEPMTFEDGETYVSHDETLPVLPSQEWSHGVGEVVTALLGHGFVLDQLVEHDSVPFVPFAEVMAPHPDHPGEHRLAQHPERLAASFTVVAHLG